MIDTKVLIGNTYVGSDYPPYLIAEIGLNHNGSLNLAKELIKTASINGANMVKFQKRNIVELATFELLDTPFPKCPSFGRTQREVRNKLEFSSEQLQELHNFSNEYGLEFSFSVFDISSLQLAIKMDLNVIKLPSHAMTNLPLLREVAKTGKPVIASLGGITWKEREKAISVISNLDLILLHCISSYPTKDEEIKLDTIPELQRRFSKVVGYSGHEAGYEISASSVLLGASVIERHLTLSHSMIGLDHKISLEPQEFAKMADLANRYFKARGVITGKIEDNEKVSRYNYHVSVCTKRKILKGELITANDICCKQPRGGEENFFGGLEYDDIVNRIALVDIPKDVPIPKKSIQLTK